MAKTKAVWGIDIGQSALKALRCHLDENDNIVADSYDYIEYPKALSLPDADEELLVKDALDAFLSRNELHGDIVAMCVSGQSGLSRFFKPPPVDSKTLPDIVKYEVKQQIPFPIEDVIWDWQGLGGTEMDNVLVDAEVGLFAIKRDTVFAALQPFLRSDVEVDLIQLSPLATQNVICHEVLENIPAPDEIDMDNMPESVVVLSMGTDATDLIVTNGIKLWLRNIPIGGNHFTKELSRELKLTHAKAEHLKRNARQAEDPKTVFQAMRRVFNDLKKEIERSLSYYAGMEKNAKIERIVLLGNAARLPGLRQYLNKQLDLDIVKVNEFHKLSGPVVEERTFKENLLSFAPCYGLCLQGLDKARVDTNLLPTEFVNERIIRAKKPWVLASVGLLMLGMLFSYFFVNQRWWGVHDEYKVNGVSWKQAKQQVESKASQSSSFKLRDEEQREKLNHINAISSELSEASETQATWSEFLYALDQVLPRDERLIEIDENGKQKVKIVANPDEIPFEDRMEIYIDHIESVFRPDLMSWQKDIIDHFRHQQGIDVGGPRTVELIINGVKRTKTILPPTEYDISSPGWVIEIKAHHFYNSQEKMRLSQHGIDFVKKYLLDRIVNSTFTLPNAEGQPTDYKFEDIGVYYPTQTFDGGAPSPRIIPNPNFRETDDSSEEGEATKKEFKVMQYNFIIQMAFIPMSPEGRDAERAARLIEDDKTADASGQTADAATSPTAGQPATDQPATDNPQPDANATPPNNDNQAAPPTGDAATEPKTDPSTADDSSGN